MWKPRRNRKKKKPSPESYKKRSYRNVIDPGNLISCFTKIQETDLHILATKDVSVQIQDSVYKYRNQIENYIALHPIFSTSLTPLSQDNLAPPIIKDMLRAGVKADVGPMAAVAGAIAEFVGKDLLKTGIEEIMIENGGDIYLNRTTDCIASIFAGSSPLSQKVGVKIPLETMPVGLCTSSGTVGHSLSLGKADSVTVLASSTALADASATRLGNEVMKRKDMQLALDVAKDIPGLIGVIIIQDDQLGAWGKIELVNL